MNQMRTERFIILLVTLACIGLTIESIMLKWEFWVPPLIIVGALLLWIINLTGKPDYGIRQLYYLAYAILTVLFHGVHKTSFFDVAVIVVLVMIVYSFFNHVYMMNVFLIEFFIIIAVQFVLEFSDNVTSIGIGSDARVGWGGLEISRLALHVTVVLLVYFTCIKAISDREQLMESEQEKDRRIENVESDMEDFLSNISHEFRTPVNVVNGMSDLLIKRDIGYEAYSIRNAGVRLSYQIEDILDYTECKRHKLLLEEDEYISTSLINDVVTSFRMLENYKDLEMIVDIDPRVPYLLKGDIKKLHKIFRHLLDNSIKFTRTGGIYVKMYTEPADYGVNLCIEVTDTGIGMDRRALEAISEGMYQVNKKRNRSTGGIGLGLYIVYGFTHKMGGFVKIESERRIGTTVRVTIPQKVVDDKPCLSLSGSFSGDLLFHVKPGKYKVPALRDFYRSMAANLARGIRVPLYPAETVREIERLMEKLNVTNIFMGQEEYEDNPEYFDELSKGDIVVAVSANPGFKPTPGSQVMVMPKPLYAYPVIRILNEGKAADHIESSENSIRPSFAGVKALIVDDEPMNLVVATGLFKDYDMDIDTAGGGKEAIDMFRQNEYDVIFMDHMMPEMDGVEAMKHIKTEAKEQGREAVVVALTANVVSGAKEMFFKEGFDGFIAKPINMADFERVMIRVLPANKVGMGGEKA